MPSALKGRVRAAGSFFGFALVVAGVACSGDNSGSVGNNSPATLVSECQRVCDNLATCGAMALGLEIDCKNACGALGLVQVACLNQFAGYLTCLSGASSVQCFGDHSVIISPSDCEADRQTFLNCNPGPSAIAACVALPGNNGCAASSDFRAAFCVGTPPGCTAPSPNPLGIGTYCCP